MSAATLGLIISLCSLDSYYGKEFDKGKAEDCIRHAKICSRYYKDKSAERTERCVDEAINDSATLLAKINGWTKIKCSSFKWSDWACKKGEKP